MTHLNSSVQLAVLRLPQALPCASRSEATVDGHKAAITLIALPPHDIEWPAPCTPTCSHSPWSLLAARHSLANVLEGCLVVIRTHGALAQHEAPVRLTLAQVPALLVGRRPLSHLHDERLMRAGEVGQQVQVQRGTCRGKLCLTRNACCKLQQAPVLHWPGRLSRYL